MAVGGVVSLLCLIIVIGLYYGGIVDILDTIGTTRSVEKGRVTEKLLGDARWVFAPYSSSVDTQPSPVCIRLPEQCIVRVQLACSCNEHSYVTVVPRHLFDVVSEGDIVDVVVRFGRFRNKLHFVSFTPRPKRGEA